MPTWGVVYLASAVAALAGCQDEAAAPAAAATSGDECNTGPCDDPCQTGPCHDPCETGGCGESTSGPPMCTNDGECSLDERCIGGDCIALPEGYCPESIELESIDIGIANEAVAADVDGDGRRELVVLEDTTTLATYFHDPNTGARKMNTPFGEPLNQPIAADLDNDGLADLVAIAWDRVVLLRGDGTGAFVEEGAIYDVALETAAGDFDADGNVDLAIASSENLVHFGDGALGFEPARELAFGSATLGLVAGNLDGIPGDDLVFAYEHLAAVLGAGPDGWTKQLSRGDGEFLFVFPHIAEVSGDGRDEVLLVEPTLGIVVVTGTPDAPLAELVFHDAEDLIGPSVAAGDFVGGGATDLVAAGGPGLAVIIDGQCWTHVPTQGSVDWVVALDFDADGRDDIAFSHTGAGVLNGLTVMFGHGS